MNVKSTSCIKLLHMLNIVTKVSLFYLKLRIESETLDTQHSTKFFNKEFDKESAGFRAFTTMLHTLRKKSDGSYKLEKCHW